MRDDGHGVRSVIGLAVDTYMLSVKVSHICQHARWLILVVLVMCAGALLDHLEHLPLAAGCAC